MIRSIIISALIMVSIAAFGQATTQHRIVMQLSSADTLEWKGTINNLKNLKKGWGDNVVIELVAHGPGVGFLLSDKTTQTQAIQALKAQGVIFAICENTLREKKIDTSLIIPEAVMVPMGIGEIVLKQEEGWSYVKAGF